MILILIPRLNSSIWAINGTIKGTTTPVKSGPESNGNEKVLHIPQTPRLGLHHEMQFNVILQTIRVDLRVMVMKGYSTFP